MAFDLEDINRAVTDDPRGFIAECDRVYNGRIAATAENARVYRELKEGYR